jgi:hypothetical protein
MESAPAIEARSMQAEKRTAQLSPAVRISGGNAREGQRHGLSRIFVSQIAKRTALMGLNFGAGFSSAGESPRGGVHGDGAPIGRSTGKLTTVKAGAPARTLPLN